MSLRVAILCEYATLNGGERSLLAALTELARSPGDIEPIVCCPPEGPLPSEAARLGLPTFPWHCHADDGGRRPRATLLEDILRLVDRLVPDRLHANSLSMGRLTGAAAPSLRVPTTAHLRDIVRLSAAAVADLNANSRLAAVSEATRRFHVGQGIDPARVVTLHNGVDLDRFRPNTAAACKGSSPRTSLRTALGLPDDAILVATIGQIGLRKGHDVLARAAAISGPRFPAMHFLVIGERYSGKAESLEFERAVDDSFRAAGLADRLHRLGYRHDIAALLPQIDLLAHPARQEPLGRVLLEAAASGVAIVATDVGGTREILTDGENALLVPPDDPAALANAIELLASDQSLRRALGQAARRQAECRFDLRRTAPRLAEFWHAGP